RSSHVPIRSSSSRRVASDGHRALLATTNNRGARNYYPAPGRSSILSPDARRPSSRHMRSSLQLQCDRGLQSERRSRRRERTRSPSTIHFTSSPAESTMAHAPVRALGRGPIVVHVPAEVTFDLAKFNKVIANLGERLGC